MLLVPYGYISRYRISLPLFPYYIGLLLKRESRSNNNATQSESAGSDSDTRDSTHTGTLYLQTELVPGNDGHTTSHITCYCCGKKGHYADNCPNASCTVINEQHTNICDTN